MGILFVDLNQILFKNDDLKKSDLFLDDGVHLNIKAYLLWISTIKSKLKELKL